jgi:acyl dehydratase
MSEKATRGDGAAEAPPERIVRSVADLKALIGQEIALGQWVRITQQLIDDFNAATGGGPSATAAAGQAARPGQDRSDDAVVPGFFLLSAGAILGHGRRGVAVDLGGKLTVNYGMNRARFPVPVRVGQWVRTRTKLINVEEIDHRAVQITRLQTIEIEGESEPACVAETLGRVYF